MLELLKDESGQGLVEYALIISIVAVGAVLALRNLKGHVSNVLNNAAAVLS